MNELGISTGEAAVANVPSILNEIQFFHGSTLTPSQRHNVIDLILEISINIIDRYAKKNLEGEELITLANTAMQAVALPHSNSRKIPYEDSIGKLHNSRAAWGRYKSPLCADYMDGVMWHWSRAVSKEVEGSMQHPNSNQYMRIGYEYEKWLTMEIIKFSIQPSSSFKFSDNTSLEVKASQSGCLGITLMALSQAINIGVWLVHLYI